MTIENLRALVKGMDLTMYQKALALDELNMVDKLLKDQSKEIETKSAEEFIISTYGEEWLIYQWQSDDVIDIMQQYASSKTSETKALLIHFLDSIRKYEHERGEGLQHDERDSKEFVSIYLKDNPQQYASSQPVTVSEKEIIDYVSDVFLDDINEGENNLYINGMIDGAKWMRNKLTSPQPEKDESKQMQQEAIKDRLKRNIGGEIPPRLGSGVNPPKK